MLVSNENAKVAAKSDRFSCELAQVLHVSYSVIINQTLVFKWNWQQYNAASAMADKMYSTKLVNFVAFLVIFQSNFLSYSNSMFGLVSQLNFCSHQADDEPMNNNEEITSTRTKNSQCIPKRWPTSYTLHFQIIRNVEVLSTEQRWYTRYWLYDTETTIIITHEFHGDTSLKTKLHGHRMSAFRPT